MTDPGRALTAVQSLSVRLTVERLIAGGALVAVVMWVALGRMNVEHYPYVGVPAVAVALTLAWRVDGGRWWAAYILGFLAFVYVRAFADETAIAWKFDYVIDLERTIAGGAVPTTWLQARWYDAGGARLHDYVLFGVYGSYFFLPQLAAILLWRFARVRFRVYVAATLMTLALGVLGALLLPTPPPWLAADRGYLSEANRIAVDVVFGVATLDAAGGTRDLGASLAGSNPVASMPSVHMALTVLVALAAWGRHRLLAAAAVLYVAAMALALVYLGEHYAVDLLAGAATAGVAWWGVQAGLRRIAAGRARYQSP